MVVVASCPAVVMVVELLGPACESTAQYVAFVVIYTPVVPSDYVVMLYKTSRMLQVYLLTK